MSKTYIIFTTDIHPIGGMQLYTAGKAMFLEKNHWNVKIIFEGKKDGKCQIEFLNKYLHGGFSFIYSDPFAISLRLRKRAINDLIEYIGDIEHNEKVYIESQSDFTAIWAELIANQLNCKHICFNCNEIFRGSNKIYERYLEYFKYKYSRKELYTLHNSSFSLLFGDYYCKDDNSDFIFDALELDPVQDISFKYAESLSSDRINIAYIGRSTKGYVPNIINGVAKFAKNNSQLNIRFIMIGDAGSIKKSIYDAFRNTNNVVLDFLGDLVPIPRMIFNKLDVVIAGAVCAELSTCEGVMTIVPDCNTYRASGILGYTVSNSMYCESTIQNDYDYYLEEILIQKKYKNKACTFSSDKNSDEVYESQLKKFENIVDDSHYFDIGMERHYSLKKRIISDAKVLFPNLYFWFINNFNYH